MAEFRESFEEGPWLGARRRHFESCDSTNDRLWQWIAEGAAPGSVVLGMAQSAGRGRQGRAWLSEPGQGLYFSAYVAPRVDARELPALALVSALALCDLLEARAVADFGVKWPNDVLVGGRKLAGILVESRSPGPPRSVVGIGLNLRPPSTGWPSELAGRAISLHEAGLESDFEELADAICSCLGSRVESFERGGFGGLRRDFAAYDLLRGRAIEYAVADRVGRGVADGVEVDGALRVLDVTGELELLRAGEVHLRT